MNHLNPKARRSSASPAEFRLTPVAAACAALFASGAAFAQQSQPEAVVITGTGIKASLESSIAIKRNNDSIVEAVTAEDLGKLPDVSIAESLARLPGVTSQRVDGRAQVLSIRGLAPKFGVTLLNGREMVSTGDNRSVEYDQFPSELINSATVYKTPDAALGAQGLAGTVNMQTVRPLDFKGRQANVNVRAEHNSNGSLVPGSNGNGARLSASYIDQFANNTLGVALGFAHLDSPNQQKYSKDWWWGNTGLWGAQIPGIGTSGSNLHGFEAGISATETKRDGLMAVVEYKPNKNFRSQLDLYFSKFKQTAQGREFQSDTTLDWGNVDWGTGIASGNSAIYKNAQIAQVQGEPVIVGGSISNVDPRLVMRYDQRNDDIKAFGWNNELKLGAWTTIADLSYSRAKRDETKAEVYASATTQTGFSSFSIPPYGDNYLNFVPVLNYADPNIIRLRGINDWGSLNGVAQAGSSSPIAVTDEMKSLRLAAKRNLEIPIFSSFEGGVNYNHRTKDMNRSQFMYTLKNGTPCVTAENSGNNCAAIPAGILQSPANLGFAGMPGIVSFNLMDAVNAGLYNVGPSNADQAPGRTWKVDEKIATWYGKLGIDVDSKIPLRGNLGLQYVSTDQNSAGLAWDSSKNVAVPISGGKSYTDVLPSLNLIADFGSGELARLGIAKVLARPNMEDMRAGFSGIGVATSGLTVGQWSANGGNPGLEPWRATSYDLSFEKYFGKRSYVALAGFNKRLKTSIYTDTVNYDFTGFPNSTNITPVSNIGRLTAPANGNGGFVRGWEFTVALEGAMIHPMLDGFGATASRSDTSSSVKPADAPVGGSLGAGDHRINPNLTLEGLSGKVINTMIYYEKNGWQARVAQRYRSAYVGEVRGVWIANSFAAIGAETITDAQVGYSWENGPMKGLSVLFQVNNLTDTPYRTYYGDESSNVSPIRAMPESYQRFGRQFLLGVTYKM